jgi:hypothetical protein
MTENEGDDEDFIVLPARETPPPPVTLPERTESELSTPGNEEKGNEDNTWNGSIDGMNSSTYNNNHIININIIDGIDGIDGIEGIDGIDGIEGIEGIDGIDGIEGIDGIDGIDGIEGIDREDSVENSIFPDGNIPDANIPDDNVPGDNVPGDNVPGDNVPDGNIPGDNINDSLQLRLPTQEMMELGETDEESLPTLLSFSSVASNPFVALTMNSANTFPFTSHPLFSDAPLFPSSSSGLFSSNFLRESGEGEPSSSHRSLHSLQTLLRILDISNEQIDNFILQDISNESMESYHQESYRRNTRRYVDSVNDHTLLPFDKHLHQDRLQKCFVCQEEFVEEELVLELQPCGHFFHEPCVQEAVQFQELCPLCRKPIQVKTQENKENKENKEKQS